MIRPACFFILAFPLAAAPAEASIYTATLAVPTSARVIARDISWNCGAAACQSSSDESRPIVLCEALAKRAGRIEAFIVDGRAFTPAELERCNLSARAEPAEPLAAK